jgi:hypothetical protein
METDLVAAVMESLEKFSASYSKVKNAMGVKPDLERARAGLQNSITELDNIVAAIVNGMTYGIEQPQNVMECIKQWQQELLIASYEIKSCEAVVIMGNKRPRVMTGPHGEN